MFQRALPILLLASSSALAANVLVSDFQSELGCSADLDVNCAATTLTVRPQDGVEAVTLTVPAGTWSFALALDHGASGTIGQNATLDGAPIALTLPAATLVTFLYDPDTRWLATPVTHTVATAAGNFQSELGCPGDWDPTCLRSWLRDPDGDAIFTFSTTQLPPGDYAVKAAHNLAWDENYGAGGIPHGADIPFSVANAGDEVLFSYNGMSNLLTVTVEEPVSFDLSKARAHWLSSEFIVWNVGDLSANTTFTLHTDADGAIAVSEDGVASEESFTLSLDVLPQALRERFPHLANLAALKLPQTLIEQSRTKVRGQLALVATDPQGKTLRATSLQIAGALDSLFPYSGSLGPSFDASGTPTLRVWAPTARNVELRLYDAATGPTFTAVPMTLDAATGVWSATGEAGWNGRFYQYAVELYRRELDLLVTNVVSDPWGLSASTNGERSQIIDLADPALAPEGWASLQKPPFASLRDSVLYELHVRDFSISDVTVPEAHRGTYLGFTHPDSAGMKHLARIAAAGVSHVHLLPVFDFGSVNEDRSAHQSPAVDLVSLPPDSDQQQAAVEAVAQSDGFNWGYDPLHYTIPEGSYATDPQGSARIREFRQMVQGLAGAGLRTVMDVVYNHTHKSGQTEGSVLDRIVPGYYQRLNADGAVETSTCCENTATEFAMMDKLVVDSVVTWAKAYKVDGFRFDLMGHHPKANLLRVRDALRSLTVARDGVDGSKIVLYGEGWDFGEVVNNTRFVNASQLNMVGTEIGTFNDRFRDAVRGGSPFDGLQDQGFATGLVLAHNGVSPGSDGDRLGTLRNMTEVIQIGLTGNLADYELTRVNGSKVLGRNVDWRGGKAGYNGAPMEAITYVSAHDNQTLFDGIQLKAPRSLPMDERVRMHNLATSLNALGQGIPFFHAGDELLRSKSFDRNSYESGDWFNRVDWTGQTNAWGSGLPPHEENGAHWSVMGPLLADASLRPGPEHMRRAADHFEELLKLRKTLPKFSTLEEVKANVSFEDLGTEAFAMWLEGADESKFAIVFNAKPQAVELKTKDGVLVPHPLHAESTDARLREAAANGGATVSVPARTTMVFSWQAREGGCFDCDFKPGVPEPTGCGCTTTSGALGMLSLALVALLGSRSRRRAWTRPLAN